MKEDFKLIDNVSASQYEIEVDGLKPRIVYIRKQNQIHLTHTEVPTQLEGRGIGSALLKLVLEDIKEKKLTLVPVCPFIVSYIERHPEWKTIVLKD